MDGRGVLQPMCYSFLDGAMQTLVFTFVRLPLPNLTSMYMVYRSHDDIHRRREHGVLDDVFFFTFMAHMCSPRCPGLWTLVMYSPPVFFSL
jgi:hypothetical protein